MNSSMITNNLRLSGKIIGLPPYNLRLFPKLNLVILIVHNLQLCSMSINQHSLASHPTRSNRRRVLPSRSVQSDKPTVSHPIPYIDELTDDHTKSILKPIEIMASIRFSGMYVPANNREIPDEEIARIVSKYFPDQIKASR